MEIKVIKNGYTMQDAFERLYKRSKHFTIENMDLLFYPYTLIEFDVIYGGKLERLDGKVLCMCDMWRGDYSIARSKGEFVNTNAEDNTVMPSKIKVEDAIKKALKKLDDYEKELKVLEKNEKILDLIVKAKDAEGDEKIQALEEIERIIYSYGI